MSGGSVKIDEVTGIGAVSGSIGTDTTLSLFGGALFSFGFNEGGSAGTATSFKVLASTGFGT